MTITLSTRSVVKWLVAVLAAGAFGLHAYRDHQEAHLVARWSRGMDAVVGRLLATPEVKDALLKAYPKDAFVLKRIEAAEKANPKEGAR